MSRITINGNRLNPVAQSPQLGALGLLAVDASNSNYILVQVSSPFKADQRAQLAQLGAVIHEYVSDKTYLCGYKGTDLAVIRGLPFVTWANTYLPLFKVEDTLKPEATYSILGAGPGASFSRTPHKVDIIVHQDVDASADKVKSAIATAARVDAESLTLYGDTFRISVEERHLDDVAAVDEVRKVLEVHPVKLLNNVARTILRADVVVNGTGYTGQGQVVAVADTGFDTGSTTDTLPAFTGRVAKLYNLGRNDKADDPAGHGTHVCGSVLGDGNSDKMGGKIQGTAPSATLVVQSLLDSSGSLGGVPVKLADLFSPPYEIDNARVHTNSWGSYSASGAAQLKYDPQGNSIDDFIWNHPDMVVCFAAGNSGTDPNRHGIVDPGSIGGEAAAKNCITVGACESNRPDIATTYGALFPNTFAAPPIFDDPMANRPDGMAAFSSRGPTLEQRIKPDLVAPGTSILSAHSRNAPAVTYFGASSDDSWMYDSGTSMATPLLAGCVAVLRETLVKNGVKNPSAARIKVLLINGADDMPGQYNPSETGPSPNNSSGFGRVNLANSVIIVGQTLNAGCGEGGPLALDQESTFAINVPQPTSGASPGAALKITLVWTDPPGSQLQNDLDLIVKAADGTERHGNMGLSADFDRVNNVEQVVWTNIPPGAVQVTIRAFAIAVTGNPQPYAYAWRLT